MRIRLGLPTSGKHVYNSPMNHSESTFNMSTQRRVFRFSLLVEDNTIPVQPILLPPKWENLVSQKVVSLAIFELTVPVVNWQPLILLKLYVGGPQDLLDAQQILAVRQPNPIELQGVSEEAKQLDLLKAFQSLVNRLHQ